MQHKSFFTFKSSSNYDLGLQIGETFKLDINDLLTKAKKKTAKILIRLSIGSRKLTFAKELLYLTNIIYFV